MYGECFIKKIKIKLKYKMFELVNLLSFYKCERNVER